jgi:hypothetical protein
MFLCPHTLNGTAEKTHPFGPLRSIPRKISTRANCLIGSNSKNEARTFVT